MKQLVQTAGADLVVSWSSPYLTSSLQAKSYSQRGHAILGRNTREAEISSPGYHAAQLAPKMCHKPKF